GSTAHVKMLSACQILTEDEAALILSGLETLKEKVQAGDLEFSVSNEDIHLNLEKHLIDEIGPVGGKLHTARSRNDQVATDMHLYLKNRVKEIIEAVAAFQSAIVEQAEAHVDTIVP